MNEELQQILETNVDLALAHGYTMNHFFSLVEQKGYYMPPEQENLSCHPLETVVLGQLITAPINVEIATNLGVHPAWVDGFLDGYGDGSYNEAYHRLQRNDPLRQRYTEGFEDGPEVEDWIKDMEW
jgi:hypothetical protein